MAKIGAGDLDRRITIQTATVSRGDTGGHEESWATLAAVWASVRDLSGRETFNAEAAGSNVKRVVIIRHRTDVTDKMRILFDDSTIARIAWTRELGRKEWLELYCEKVNNG